MNAKIHRRCKCGCGQITNPGKKWINNHDKRNVPSPMKDRRLSEKIKLKMSLAKMGNTCGRGNKGRVFSEETKRRMSLAAQNRSEKARLNSSLAHLKCNPNYQYCDEWKDRLYRKDLRKDYCENAECRKISKRRINHHINLNKKDCKPYNVMTLCRSCHQSLHRKLELGNIKIVDPKDFITAIRKDKVVYIHKRTRKKTILKRLASGPNIGYSY